MAIVQNCAIPIIRPGHEKGFLDHQAANTMGDEEDWPRALAGVARQKEILEQVFCKKFKAHTFQKLAMPVQ